MKRVALKASFIDACVEENNIVNEEDYLLDLSDKDTPVKKGRGRPPTHSISFNTSDASQFVDEETASLLESLPAPPAPAYLSNGYNKYTDGEHRFVLQCAAILYRRNPQMPYTKLFEIIGQKV